MRRILARSAIGSFVEGAMTESTLLAVVITLALFGASAFQVLLVKWVERRRKP